MENKSLFKNSIYKCLFSIANIAIPIIIGPYITKLLDVDLYGAYNKVYAEFQIFLIFATFGIYTFGVREISKIRNDKKAVATLFTNLFVLSIITNTAVGIIYITYGLISSTGITTQIYMVFIIQIIANVFYVEFLNKTIKNYKFITIKTLIVKIIYLTLLLLLVRKSNDIIIYAIIISFIVFLNNIISYIYVRKKIKFDFKSLKLLQFVRPLFLVLILTNISILYSQLDKIMLGKFVGDVAVTKYYIPYYIIYTLASIPYSVINVAIPRLTYVTKAEGMESYKKILKTTISSLLFIIIPMCFGVAVLSKEIIFLYAGDKYGDISNTLVLACIIKIIISIESVLTNLVLYVNNKEKIIVRFSFIFGISNLIMNSLLVIFKILNPFTAMLTTGIAEVLLIITQYIYIRNKMKIKVPLVTKQNIAYLILSILFIPISYIVKKINFGFYINIIIIITICASLYSGVLLIKKDESLYIIINKLKNKLKLNKE